MKTMRLLAAMCAAVVLTFGQTTTGSLTGNLVDPSGAAIAGADVSITEQGRQTSLSTKTDESGRFAFTTLQPGNYTLDVKHQGFKALKRENIALLANDFIYQKVRARSRLVWFEEVGPRVNVHRDAPKPGRQSADDSSLDADMILAAQAGALDRAGNQAVIATTNVRHLSLFATARIWREIGR